MKKDVSDVLAKDSDILKEEIGAFMSTPVLSIDHIATVQEAGNYMEASNVGSLLVKEYEDFVGIITETDLTRKVVGANLNPEVTKVYKVMSKPLHKMDRYFPVEQANEYMHKNNIRHLAITEGDKVVGMLSVKDLVAYYAKSSFRMNE
jgi:signal-transduction protein with cAMP-binding, CBS, and nucleotidyltransferase domain